MLTYKDIKAILIRGGTVKLALVNDYDECRLFTKLVSVHNGDNDVYLRWHGGVETNVCPYNTAILLNGSNEVLSILDIMPIGSYKTSDFDLSVELSYGY